MEIHLFSFSELHFAGVLTSYVGVTGLVRNMSSDRCLPQFLLQRNSLRNTNHWIILGNYERVCYKKNFDFFEERA